MGVYVDMTTLKHGLASLRKLHVHSTEGQAHEGQPGDGFQAALFVMSTKWKQPQFTPNSQKWKPPKCPSTAEWINDLSYLHTMEMNELQRYPWQHG